MVLATTKPALWARLFFNEVIYWMVGNTPESHHATAAYLWHELGRNRRSVAHCKCYLAHTHSDHIVAMRAFGHSELEEWSEAVQAYRSLTSPFADPFMALGLAYAKFDLETSVGRGRVCANFYYRKGGAGQGATRRNGCSIPTSCNAAMRVQNRAICRVAYSPNG